jgi:hypothetical protein
MLKVSSCAMTNDLFRKWKLREKKEKSNFYYSLTLHTVIKQLPVGDHPYTICLNVYSPLTVEKGISLYSRDSSTH